MKLSIRAKLFVMLFTLSVGFVLFSIMLNTTLLKPFYTRIKEKALVDSLQTVYSLDFSGPKIIDELLSLEEKENIRILIVDERLNTFYCSIDEREPLYLFIQNWTYEKQVVDSWGSYTISGGKPFQYGAYSTATSTSYLTIYAQMTKSFRGFKRDFIVFLNTPVVAIEDGAQVANSFTLIVGLALLLLGGVATFIIGSRFAAPIVRASYAAEQVANLNFGVRLPVTSTDELGQLASSINNLSDQLRTKISELSVANEQLRRELEHKQQIDDMRRTFISDVSHELKTPLSIILGYCEGLQINVNSDEREYYCSVIEDEAIKMSNLASRLLLLAELESNDAGPVMQVFDLRELADDRLTRLGHLLEERGISYRLDCELPQAYVSADPEGIEEVMNNLLTNAKNHTPDGGEITASLTAEDGRIVCRIHNTGSHIPEESLALIWGSFYKVDKARTRAYGGSGLGLKIVSTILQSHGAEYGAENTDDGVEFRFSLAAAEPPENNENNEEENTDE